MGPGKQVGVETQAGDDTHVAADGGEEFESGESAVGDDDDAAVWQPVADLQDRLLRLVDQRLRRARLVGIKAQRGREQGEERQGHDAPGPGHGDEQHGGQPAQATGLDEVSLGRTHRITIDAAGLDLGAPAPLDGVVEADRHGCLRRRQGGAEKTEQAAGERARRPHGPAEDAVTGREVVLPFPSEDAQHRRHGVLARRQNGARHQQQGVAPGRAGEQIGEPGKPGQQRLRQPGSRRIGDRVGLLHRARRSDPAPPGKPPRLRQIDWPALGALAP